jgi:Dyp-type peroxidase family
MKLTQFLHPHKLSELDRKQRAAWSSQISYMIDTGVSEVADQKGASQFYNPTGPAGADAADETKRLVLWSALPQRLISRYGIERAVEFADTEMASDLLGETERGDTVNIPYRKQTEYCEWLVQRDGAEDAGDIRRVTFTTETLEYWWTYAQGQALGEYGPEITNGRPVGDLQGVLARYREILGIPGLQLADITFGQDVYESADDMPGGRKRPKRKLLYKAGEYNPWNRWNTSDGLVHMSAVTNPMGALVDECAVATVRRESGNVELRDPIRCVAALGPTRGGAGINDSADIAIVGVVGSLARAGAMVTLEDPLSIAMLRLDTGGWRLPDKAPRGATPERYWRVLRGTKERALRAELFVPPEHGFSISDITIRGVPIRYGSQIAQCLTIGFGVTAMKFGRSKPRLKRPAGRAVRSLIGSTAIDAVSTTFPPDPRYEPAFPDEPTATVPKMGGYDEPVLDDEEIQGNVLAGFKKNFQWVIGFDIADVGLARQWIGARAHDLATTASVARYNRRYRAGEQPPPISWLNLAFSFAAVKLLRPSDADDIGSLAFKQGIAARGVFAVEPEPHILAVIAADDEALLPRFLGTAEEIRARAPGWGLRLRFHNVGTNHEGPTSGREHFGFTDNISQPAVRGLLSSPGNPPLTPREIALDAKTTDAWYRGVNEAEFARPGHVLVWPGEFVVGYPRQSLQHPRRPSSPSPWSPAWLRNGSYLVYLKMRQNVDAFNELCARRAEAEGVSTELAAARLIGRWKSGAPLIAHPSRDGKRQSNHFMFAHAAEAVTTTDGKVEERVAGDPRGAHCPFSAHIRKVNPRDETTELGGLAASLRRRILRRGIPYGPRHDGPGDKRDRGLMFLCYQASIEEQFEFVMTSWLSDPLRPAGPGGVDPLFAESALIKTLEGGYYLSPSVSAVRLLAR